MSTLLNFEALARLDETLSSRNDSQYYFVKPSEFADNSQTFFRLLLPRAYDGMFFYRATEHWFKLHGLEKSTKVIDPSSSFGKEASIIEEFKENNPSYIPLLTSPRQYDKNAPYSVQEKFVIPVLIFDDVKWAGAQMSSYKVRNEKVGLMEVPRSVLSEIARLIQSPFRQTTEKSIADPEHGFTLAITKSVVNKRVSYKLDCMPTPSAIDAKWEDNVDLDLFYRRQMYSDTYIKSVLTHYLTGKGIMDEPEYRFPELREGNATPTDVAAPVFTKAEPPVFKETTAPTSMKATEVVAEAESNTVPPVTNDLLSRLKGLQ